MNVNKDKFESRKNDQKENSGAIIDAASSRRLRLHKADGENTSQTPVDLAFLADVPLKISIVLAETKMPVRELLALATDSVVQLNKLSGDPIDIYVEDQKLGKGEVIVLQEKLRIRVLEITQPGVDFKLVPDEEDR
jgi:flagellar motor switch protein FliN